MFQVLNTVLELEDQLDLRKVLVAPYPHPQAFFFFFIRTGEKRGPGTHCLRMHQNHSLFSV